MTRSTPDLLVALAAASFALSSACAWDDGQPWGLLELDLAARFDLPADRDVDGAIKTARDYLVSLDGLELVVTAVTVAQRASGGAGAFDPAAPPEGYSLCHNGHCHAADGRLVSYEDIAAELAGGAASAGPSLTLAGDGTGAAVPVAPATVGDAVAVGLGDCPDGCAFGRGALDTVKVVVAELRVRGVVHDQLTGAAARLPTSGRAFDVVVTPTDALTASLTGAFDQGEPVGLRVRATVSVPAALFDDVDWGGAADAELPSALGAALGEHATLDLDTSRFD